MSQITFTRPDGKACSAFYAGPSGEPDKARPTDGDRAPGVVVIQEWWGLNDQIRGVAQKLADSGFRALVPDLYRGQVGLDAKEAEHLMGALDFGDAAGQDVRGAVQYLKKTSAKVAVTGFCMGGALTMLSAVHVPEADAAVAWYGFPPLDYIDATKIKAPVMGHFAIEDAFFPIAQVDALEQKLKAAGVKYTFHRYHAQHAFANETAVNSPIATKYDEKAAEAAWQRTIEFLRKNLG